MSHFLSYVIFCHTIQLSLDSYINVFLSPTGIIFPISTTLSFFYTTIFFLSTNITFLNPYLSLQPQSFFSLTTFFPNHSLPTPHYWLYSLPSSHITPTIFLPEHSHVPVLPSHSQTSLPHPQPTPSFVISTFFYHHLPILQHPHRFFYHYTHLYSSTAIFY